MSFGYWQPPQKSLIPKALWPWLTEQGSLTRRLKQYSQNGFSVQVLYTGWQRAERSEVIRLGSDFHQYHYCREVLLMDGDLPVVFARTIVPLQGFRVLQRSLMTLGNRSLGAMLFSDPSVERDALEVLQLQPRDKLFQHTASAIDVNVKTLWARRSCFKLQQQALLVSEVFLPTKGKAPW